MRFFTILTGDYTVPPEEIAKIRENLEKHAQSHLLTFYDELDEFRRAELLAQVQELDLSQVDRWVEKYVKSPSAHKIPDRFTPAAAYDTTPSPSQRQKYSDALELGEELISTGKVAPLVVAGGQGTRLGFDGPKGNFPISPVSGKTLFEIFAETITSTSKKYGVELPWYVMASPLNYQAIKKVFRDNNFYGLKADNVFIFQQGTLPNFSFDGEILLSDKSRIARSPDGHGGIIKALQRSGALADMKSRNIKYISYWQVDNPVIKIFDRLFLGLHELDKSDMSSKALAKEQPYEKVGNFCLADGKVTVIEYSDLSDELAEKTNPDGSLLFNLGSIGIHIINVEFVERLNAQGLSLPPHRAVKKIPHIDSSGRLIHPEKPNAVKLEKFIFDALPFTRNSVIFKTVRREEFAPVKNATGRKSPESTRQLMVNRAAGWLEAAGIQIPRRPDGPPDCLIELAPSFALDADDVKKKAHRVPVIKRGGKVYLD